MRLPRFTVPVTGETTSSVMSRFLAQTAGPTYRKLAWFGPVTAAPSSLVPLDPRALAGTVPIGHPWYDDPRQIVSRHTLVPLHLFFAEPTRSNAVIDGLVIGRWKNPTAALGISTATRASQATRGKFCSRCVQENLDNGLDPVAYLEHQPELVKFCIRHDEALRIRCLGCSGRRRTGSVWRVIGQCSCDAPQCPAVIEPGQDPLSDAGWRWLACQVAALLSLKELPTAYVVPAIRLSLMARGFDRRSNIDSGAILEALETRFGREITSAAGAVAEHSRQPNAAWPSRTLRTPPSKIPDLMRMLLLSSLVTSDVRDLACLPAATAPVIAHEARGYGRRKSLVVDPPGRETIEKAIRTTNGTISAVADALGVSQSMLIVFIRLAGMRYPLSEATARRLGDSKLAAVRAALRGGEMKKNIVERLEVSRWELRLVELDDPSLNESHRTAVLQKLRSRHRQCVLDYRREHPKAHKTEIRVACTRAVEWLSRFDKKWQVANLPRHKIRSRSERLPNKRWPDIDRQRASAIEMFWRAEMSESTRPTWLSARLLAETAGAAAHWWSPARKHLPLMTAMIGRCAESRDAFYKRRITWALCNFKATGRTLSLVILNEIAGLRRTVLMEQREFVAAEAERLSIPISLVSRLSPLGRETVTVPPREVDASVLA